MADTTSSPVIRPEIALSWRRAALAGLDPDSVGRPTFADVDASSRLMVAAGPVLQDLADLMDGNAFSLMLSDRDPRIVYRWGGDHRFTAVLDAYGVVAGVRIDEGSFGTNAMGTAMETGRSVQIHGAERGDHPSAQRGRWQQGARRREARHQPHHAVPPDAGARRLRRVLTPAGHLSSCGTVAAHVGRHTVAIDSGARHQHDRCDPGSGDRSPTTHEVSS